MHLLISAATGLATAAIGVLGPLSPGVVDHNAPTTCENPKNIVSIVVTLQSDNAPEKAVADVVNTQCTQDLQISRAVAYAKTRAKQSADDAVNDQSQADGAKTEADRRYHETQRKHDADLSKGFADAGDVIFRAWND